MDKLRLKELVAELCIEARSGYLSTNNLNGFNFFLNSHALDRIEKLQIAIDKAIDE